MHMHEWPILRSAAVDEKTGPVARFCALTTIDGSARSRAIPRGIHPRRIAYRRTLGPALFEAKKDAHFGDVSFRKQKHGRFGW